MSTIRTMRRRIVIRLLATAVVAIVAGGLLLRARARDDGRPDAGAALPAAAGSVVLVGDSLNLGVEPYLGEYLSGWRIRADNLVGRPTEDGLAVLARERAEPGPIVISLGTNDDPNDSAAFHSRVNRALDLAGSTRCVIWATLWRNGAPEPGLNGVLRAAARERPRLHLLDWAAMLEDHPDWVAADATHGSPAGYRARAEETARLVRACEVTSS